MRKVLYSVLVFFGLIGSAQAEVFAVDGGSITAIKSGDDVTIEVTGIQAAKLVHFRHAGIYPVDMTGNKGVLKDVSKNGGRFQLKDTSGKWLLIVPQGNPYKMTGVVQECRKSKEGCALEVRLDTPTKAKAAKAKKS